MVKQVMSNINSGERRGWPMHFEVQATADDAKTIEGYAAVFDTLSVDLGGFRERIAPGAFTRSVAENDIRALWDHDSKYVLGRNKAGTLALGEDERGLKIAVIPPNTVWATDLVQSIRRGDVNQMSFGFYVRSDDWEDTPMGLIRTLRDVDLFDVSIVSYPAYAETSAEARARASEQRPGPADNNDAERARARARRAARQREIEILNEVM